MDWSRFYSVQIRWKRGRAKPDLPNGYYMLRDGAWFFMPVIISRSILMLPDWMWNFSTVPNIGGLWKNAMSMIRWSRYLNTVRIIMDLFSSMERKACALLRSVLQAAVMLPEEPVSWARTASVKQGLRIPWKVPAAVKLWPMKSFTSGGGLAIWSNLPIPEIPGPAKGWRSIPPIGWWRNFTAQTTHKSIM